MNENTDKKIMVEAFVQFLDCMEKAGALQYIMICGTWAEFLYAQGKVLSDFDPMLSTADIDAYIPSMSVPRDKISVPSIARENGYIMSPDRMTGQTKFLGKHDFEVEFLMAEKNVPKHNKRSNDFMIADDIAAVKSNLGVRALPLPTMELLEVDSIKSSFHGHDIRIPCPEAYVIHKILINHTRGEKMQSDREKILHLAPYLSEERFSRITKLLTNVQAGVLQNYIQSTQLPLFRKSLLNSQKGSFVMLCGLPFSGKTDIANKIVSANNNAILISLSEYQKLDIPKESIMQQAVFDIQDSIRAGKDVVYDAVNLHKETRDLLLHAAQEAGSTSNELIFVDKDLNSIIMASAELDIVPNAVIVEMQKVLMSDHPAHDQGWDKYTELKADLIVENKDVYIDYYDER